MFCASLAAAHAASHDASHDVLDKISAEVDRLADLPASKFANAMEAIQKKAKR